MICYVLRYRCVGFVCLGALFGLPGCGEDEGLVDCTTDARASVALTVVDSGGQALADAEAVFSVDGGPANDCESVGDGDYICGWEQTGDFAITVDAGDFETRTVNVSVGADECHVVTEQLQVELTPMACTDEVVPSVRVFVTDSQGMDVTSGDVGWNRAEQDDLPDPCTHLGGNEWICAEEVAGDLRIDITNAGPYELFSEVVTVEEDECHVITETLNAVLQHVPG